MSSPKVLASANSRISALAGPMTPITGFRIDRRIGRFTNRTSLGKGIGTGCWDQKYTPRVGSLSPDSRKGSAGRDMQLGLRQGFPHNASSRWARPQLYL